MVPKYIIYQYMFLGDHSSLPYISPYYISDEKKDRLLTTAEESLYSTFWEVLRVETKEDRFQRLYEILRRYTMVEDFSIIYYHEVYSRSV